MLDKDMMDNILRTFSRTDILLFMPRFEFKSSLDLAETLAEMGIRDAFSTQTADFVGISTEYLHITKVLHKAFVAVDEIGTEEAAATSIMGEAIASYESEPEVVRIDRPFIFIIRDSERDTVLFLGRVLDPTK